MRGYEACSGCGICAMSCPVWWETRDVWFTPHGRARALQGGARAEDIADSTLSCRMCGACEPVCPEKIDVMAMVRDLRTRLHESRRNPFTRATVPQRATVVPRRRGRRLLLAGPALARRPELLVRLLGSLDALQAEDDGRDLAWALEAGAPIDESRLDSFLDACREASELIVLDGLLQRLLRDRCPRIRLCGLAEALIERISTLGPRDFLVLDARVYNADQARLARLFGDLRERTGCQLNLDLQRVAIPTGSDSIQGSCETAIDWMLEGRDIDRIVVESPADLDALAARTALPVVHLEALLR